MKMTFVRKISFVLNTLLIFSIVFDPYNYLFHIKNIAFVLERLKADKTEQILLYICTLSPVEDDDKSVWLGGEEVSRRVIEAFCADGCGQVIYDCGGELVREEDMDLGSQSVFEPTFQSFRGSL